MLRILGDRPGDISSAVDDLVTAHARSVAVGFETSPDRSPEA